jgi:hypothetical protein
MGRVQRISFFAISYCLCGRATAGAAEEKQVTRPHQLVNVSRKVTVQGPPGDGGGVNVNTYNCIVLPTRPTCLKPQNRIVKLLIVEESGAMCRLVRALIEGLPIAVSECHEGAQVLELTRGRTRIPALCRRRPHPKSRTLNSDSDAGDGGPIGESGMRAAMAERVSIRLPARFYGRTN